MKVSQNISKRLDGILFGFFKAAEIRKMSVVEITCLSAFDQFNNPLKGGLYDPAMGVSPYERFAKYFRLTNRCITCGQEEESCPGHMGHIELVVPVYNIFLLSYLHKLMRIKCHHCHKIKLPESKLKNFKVMFMLLKFGLLEEYESFKKFSEIRVANRYKETSEPKPKEKRKVSESTRRGSETSTEEKAKAKEDQNAKGEEVMKEMMQDLERHSKQERKRIVGLLNVRKHPERYAKGFHNNAAIAQKLHELFKSLLRDAASVAKCPHCNCLQPSVKKEGHSKFYLTGINEKYAHSKLRTKISQVLQSRAKVDPATDLHNELDESDAESKKSESNDEEKAKRSTSKMLHPIDVMEHMKLLWSENAETLDPIFGNFVCNSKTLANPKGPGYTVIKFNVESFFIEVVPVAPNRFRPENKLSDSTYLHPHTVMLQKILGINFELKKILLANKNKKESYELKTTFGKWIELQDAINGLFDSTKGGKVTVDGESGIKQLLEKKEGMFRMKIMGKRVNYAARSVISPDPLLDTNEVGVPLFVAKKLTFPEAVNEANIEKLKILIRNGPTVWPGAVYITENGKKIALEGSSPEQREAITKSLLTNAENKVVYRHIMHGDVLLFNRQPTLHKPSFMSHIARVLPREQTIRMHYANCSSYNADFDGDEMNLHLLQNHLARSEAYNLSLSDKQYIVPTDNTPIRGLIQDIILSAVFLTMKGSFFEKSEYFQLIYSSIRTLIEKDGNLRRIKLVKPCIMKPKQLWSGKQIVSTIINIVAEKTENDEFAEKLFMKNKGRINEKFLSQIDKEDKTVLVHGNELLTGILDKASLGESTFGLIHSFYELTDSKRTGKLLSGLSRLFCNYLQMHGFTCGLDDLITEKAFEEARKACLKDIHNSGMIAQAKYLGMKDFTIPEDFDLFGRPAYDKEGKKRLKEVLKKVANHDYLKKDNSLSTNLQEKILANKNSLGELDTIVKSAISHKHSEVNDQAISSGLKKKFPDNCFSVMVLSGAKGSVLNHTQISSMLGQQELEGQRVPLMGSGKSLPSFIPYDPNIRAGGYIGDRFLTGLRTQEFFFHCMAGREGLIDTAVKTSRSGYLQRILVKNMESLIIQYDMTVRENDGSIVQFLYGEDSLDPVKVNAIEKIPFIADNCDSFLINTNIKEIKKGLDTKSIKKWKKVLKEDPKSLNNHVTMSVFNPATNFGAISERAQKHLDDFLESDPRFKNELFVNQINPKDFKQLFYAKYFESLAVPGESVGAICAQSFGEPSTQMTLNTFHLAGHGGANMTLGIPRLRELLVTKNTKTPSMTLKFKDPNISKFKAKQFARKMQKISLQDLLSSITVNEQKHLLKDGKALPSEQRFRVYDIEFSFEDLKTIKFCFGVSKNYIQKILEKIFKPRLAKTLLKILQKKKKQVDKKPDSDAPEVITYDMENLKLRRQTEGGEAGEDQMPDQSEYEGEQMDEEMGGIDEAKQVASKKDDDSDVEDSDEMIKDFEFFEGKCRFKIKLPLDADKLLMLNVVEDVCKLVSVRELNGIKKIYLLEEKTKTGLEYRIQTEGVNFGACWGMDEINPNTIDCNDIHAINGAYGIEAARNGLVQQIHKVFSHYGIGVDFRHLYLVSDYMTLQGVITPMSRAGMQHNTSALLKMSFETTMKFLTDACLFNNYDNLNTPSGKLVCGRNVQNGTGLFDVKYDFNFKAAEE